MKKENRNSRLKSALGSDDGDIIDLPLKMSNVKISRILHTPETGGCSFCFPHGIESTNSKYLKKQRSWKTHRKNKYKTKTT